MIRSDILKEIAPILRPHLVVCNIGLPSQEMHLIDDQPTNFYMLGTMGLASSIGLGLALALTVVAMTPLLVDRTKWARELHAELAEIISPLSFAEITWLALASGFAEELFFRGAMQPVLGLLITSVIFGAVHVGPRPVFVVWTTWAFVMGLLLGSIFELTGVLWGPVLAHVWINQRNMTFIRRH